MLIGVPREIASGERRVALVPEVVPQLTRAGHRVLIQRDAGLLEHPSRFYMIFTRPQWRSWLVKGAFIIAGYSLVLALHFIGSIAGSTSLQGWLMIGGIPLSLLTAVCSQQATQLFFSSWRKEKS